MANVLNSSKEIIGVDGEDERNANVLIGSVINVGDGAKTRIRVDSELSEEFEVTVGMHQGPVLSPFLSSVVVDVITVFAREGVFGELQYADDLVLMSEMVEGLRNKFLKWK